MSDMLNGAVSPRQTLAAILEKSGSPLVLDMVELPPALDCGQVLVRILYSGICGSQIGEIDAVKGPDEFLPHLLGHEASGMVLAAGPGVTTVKEGDLCVLHWRPGTGIEARPPRYTWRGKPCNAGRIATFSEYAVISENRVTRVDRDEDPILLPLFGCAVTTGFGVVVNDAGMRVGESVAVFGVGGVGLCAIQAAAMAGAWPVIAIDIFENRLELAKSMGATHCVNSRAESAAMAVRDILVRTGQSSSGADVCIDNTGKSGIIEQCYDLAAPDGRVVLVGVPGAGDAASLYTLPMHFGKRVIGSHGGGSNPARDIPRYLRLVKNGRLFLDRLVTERCELAEINVAIERMRKGESAGRCLVACKP
jgi:S-(hydroxymethyl)glutathione dehydrogenase/alcohol dehydrogenase